MFGLSIGSSLVAQCGILTSFSVIGIVVGLSLQDILKNFFAGLWILVERPFRIGDTIQVGPTPAR